MPVSPLWIEHAVAAEADLPLEEIARYASGELDAAACQRLEALADASPALAAELVLARAFRDEPAVASGAGAEVVARLKGALGAVPKTPSSKSSSRPSRFALGRRSQAAPQGRGAPWGASLRMAAMLALVIGAGMLVGRGNGPSSTAPPTLPNFDTGVVRAARVQLVAPLGSDVEVPTRLEWVPIAEASSYRVRVRALTGEVLVDVSVAGSALDLPGELIERFEGGLEWSWGVEALDVQGEIVSRSEVADVALAAPPPQPPTEAKQRE